jgi:signal transduction histidine kinase
MADVYAIRAIVNFKQKNYTTFRKNLDKMNEVAKKNKLSQGDVFVPYARVYEQVLDGKTEQALAASDSLRNLKEQYLLRCDIYRYIGDYDKAFLIQRELMHKRDSITGIMIAENIDINEKEISLLMEQQKMSKRMNLILWHTVFLALCVIALMTRNILIRRRSRKRLMAKNIELEEANRRVMAADQMKTDFIRSVSHEIRTPLNIINGFTQVLTNEKHTLEPEERHNIAETVNTSTMQITSLVNKMLALANDSTKDLLKEAEATDAHAVCQAALDTMPPVDPERIKVEFEDLTNEHGTIICTHSDSLLQILENMLENSAKFTEEGYIKLTLRNDGRMMWFTVEDTGCGIPEDKISTIFDRFVKVDEFKEGLGLGLAYCHETAEKLGGELTLDRTSEAGTTFTLRLPLIV